MRVVPSWNLNCISGKPTLEPNQNKQKHHCLGQQVHNNTMHPRNVRMKRGGGAERILVSSRTQQLAQIKPENWYPVPMH